MHAIAELPLYGSVTLQHRINLSLIAILAFDLIFLALSLLKLGFIQAS